MLYHFRVKILSGAYLNGKHVERLLSVPGSKTLEDLCKAILQSIDFDFDHLYGFTIGDKDYLSYDEEQDRGPKEDVLRKLDTFGLKKGERFRMVFDYGDEWVFIIRVEDILESRMKKCLVLDAVGEVEQYPYSDDEDWDEDWDDEWDGEDDDWDDEDDDWDDEADEYDDWDDDPSMIDINEGWDYTPSDDLFDAAFRYKKCKLWNKLWSSELFAIRFSDGETGYVSVMGRGGDHCAIGIYIGDKGFESYREASAEPDSDNPFLEHEYYLRQECLQMVFDSIDYLNVEEEAAARAYAADHGIRFSGKNAFPHFQKFEPHRIPWHPKTETEERYLIETVEVCIYLASELKKSSPADLGFMQMSPFLDRAPLYIYDAAGIRREGFADLPTEKDPVYVKPVPNAELAAKVKKIKGSGIVEALAVFIPKPVKTGPDEAPFFPFALFAVRVRDDFAIPPMIVDSYENSAEETVNALLEHLLEMNYRPAKIHVADDRTFCLLENAAAASGTELSFSKELPSIEEFSEMLFDMFMNEEDESDEDPEDTAQRIFDMVDMLLSLPEDKARTAPPEVKEAVRNLFALGIVPEEIERELRKKLNL